MKKSLKILIFITLGIVVLICLDMALFLVGFHPNDTKKLSDNYELVRIYSDVHLISRIDPSETVICPPVRNYEVCDNLIIGYVGVMSGGKMNGYFIIDTKTNRVHTRLEYTAWRKLLLKYGCQLQPDF